MRIAIVIPCLESDLPYLNACLKAIDELDPGPDVVLPYVNDGTLGLRRIRSALFDWVFNENECDLALQCSSDFHLFPDILGHVDEGAITTFSFLSDKLSMPIQMLKFLISPNMWTGCYCISRDAWNGLGNISAKYSFDGNDTSIKDWADAWGFPIKRVRSPKYRLMRPSEKMVEFVRDLPLHKKILKLGAWF